MGYDRIVGALANLGYHVSDQTLGNTLNPERFPSHAWEQFALQRFLSD